MWRAGQAPCSPTLARPGAIRPGFSLSSGMRVGLFGGSFNPAHAGHRYVADTARKHLGLDCVLWLVSPQNPLKDRAGMAPLPERLASARALAHRDDIVTDFETRIRATYTLDTLRALKGRFPGVKFVWLMGADNLAQFHRWRGWLQIARLVPMAVIARPGALIRSRLAPAAKRFAPYRHSSRKAHILADLPAPAWTYLHVPLNTLSSTAIRQGRNPTEIIRDKL